MTDDLRPADLRVPLAELGDDVAAFMQQSSGRIPLHQFLGFHIDEVGEGRARVSAELTERLQGQIEPLHGGVVFALSALAAGAATWGAWDPETSLIIAQEAHVRLHAQPRRSPIVADGRLVHRGKRSLSTECVVKDGGGHELARSSTTYLIITDYGGNPV